MYKKYIKRILDVVLSGIAIVILAIPMLIIAISIKIDDPGPVIFKQKRVGQKKNAQLTYFHIWKFRSMKMSTPHDVPTHLLENPQQYITRVGKFIRKMSLDELPQIFQVFNSTLSIVGPRAALWNQYDLIEERETYGVNDIKPGITGWAQINGRDELEISVKAKYDGEKHVVADDINYNPLGVNVLTTLKFQDFILFGRFGLTKMFGSDIKAVPFNVGFGLTL